jgi:NTP pyrophosphatase (non-canonical NTP hydrolase)
MFNSLNFSRINKSRALRWHPNGLESWSLSDWCVAVVGEVGELCNVVKKMNRARDGLVGNKETPEELRAMLLKEFADVVIYLDLLAQREKINIADAVRAKFNEVSERNGFPERL